MLRAGVGYSTSASTSRAVDEAAGAAMARAGIRQADFALAFFTSDHINHGEELTSGLSRSVQTDRTVGCSSVGVLTGDGEVEMSSGSGLAVMVVSSDSLKAVPFLHHPLRDREREIGQAIAATMRIESIDNPHLILLPDPYNCRPDPIIHQVEEQVGPLPVLGAGCSEDGSHGRTFQFCGDRMTDSGLAGLLLTGSLESSIGITQGCQPIGRPMVITKADGNFIYEIDNRPAAEVFTNTIKGPLLQDLRRALAFVFAGLPSDPEENSIEPGHYVVRNIVGLDPQKGILAVSERVFAGESMIFTLREAQRAREDLDQMLQRQREMLDGQKPALGIYFNCCARGSSLYGLSGIDTAYIRRALGEFPLIGMFGNFELGPVGKRNQLLTYTGVLALFSEKTH